MKAREKNISFNYHLPLPDKESILVSDEGKINQVMTNLLGNAFKFTKAGSIDFGYKISGNELTVWVKDTGKGIARKHQTRIFERFYQTDMSTSRDFEGAGLGLPISKGLIELMDGKIWLESKVGKGTTFYFSIPFNPTEKPAVHSTTESSIPVRKESALILIVEDDETSFMYLKTILKLKKMKWLHAADGLQAVEMCRKNPKIDLVLMDIKLPGMNGLEATRKIKAFRPGLPVIAQTAHAFEADSEAAFKAGCDDFITKPIHKEELIKKMNEHLK